MSRGRFAPSVLVVCLAVVGLLAPAAADARPYKFGERVLKRGSTGSDVRTLQRYLGKVGHRTAVDGRFGRGTRRAVRRWERSQELASKGRVTRREARILRAMVKQLAPAPPPTAQEEAQAAHGGAAYVKIEKATIGPDGKAIAPESAPAAVKAVIAAANEIHDKPYRYGGGHGKWKDSGYDCSGSMSYALHFGGLLEHSMASTGFMSWEKPGRGAWITTYAHEGHAYMVVAGLRFDTSAHKQHGSRWTTEMRSSRGFVARHPAGL